MTDAIYKEFLLNHYREPRNMGELNGATITTEGFNANCGDKVKVGLFIEDDTITQVRYQIRGCAICTASTSIMSEQLTGTKISDAQHLIQQIQNSVKHQTQWPPDTEALSGAAKSIGRHKCILLSWNACSEALTR
jgi:nitrogen fixation NifU-like protein